MKIDKVNEELKKGKKQLMDEIKKKVVIFQNNTIKNILESKEYEEMVKGDNDKNLDVFRFICGALSWLPFIDEPEFIDNYDDINIEEEREAIEKFTIDFIEDINEAFDGLVNNTMITLLKSKNLAAVIQNVKIKKAPKIKICEK